MRIQLGSPAYTLRQGMKSVHLEDGPGGNHCRRGEVSPEREGTASSTWRPYPWKPLEGGSRSVPQGVVPAERPQSRGPDPLVKDAPGAPTPHRATTGLGRDSTRSLLHPCRQKTILERRAETTAKWGCVWARHTQVQPPQREANSRDKTWAKSKMKLRLRNYQASGRRH